MRMRVDNMKMQKMFLSIIMIALSLFLLSACNKSEKENSTLGNGIKGDFEWESVDKESFTIKLYFKDKKFSMYDVDAGNPMLSGSYVIDESEKTITMKCDPVDFDPPTEWKDFKAEESTISYELSEDKKTLTLTFNGASIKFIK